MTKRADSKLFSFVIYFVHFLLKTIAKEQGFVVWMDASVRFISNETASTINRCKEVSVMSANGADTFTVTRATAKSSFLFLNEDVSFFSKKTILQATFMCYYFTEHAQENFMKPWILCALSLGCMVPDLNPYPYLPVKKGKDRHACHRFDQSISSILMHRIYGACIGDHVLRIESGVFTICRGCYK